MASSSYAGPVSLGFSKYASPAQRKAQLTAASAASAATLPTSPPPATTIATRQQIADSEAAPGLTPPPAELAVELGTSLKKQVEDHTKKMSRTVSNAVTNTHQLLTLLRESTPGSEAVDGLWKELQQLFEAINDTNAALPSFMEKQRDSMSLYHSSMMNETIRETQDELNLQHKKVNTQHNLILEQQEAFQHYKTQTTPKLKELESLQERVSRLTLEKGNFRTEVDKYKELLEQETARKAEDLKTADTLQKEVETLISSKKQLQAENETLQKSVTDMLEQLKDTEQRVTERFVKELEAKAEELQKATAESASLNTQVNTLKTGESNIKKELDKIKSENRLLSVKYTNQASEHATAFTVCYPSTCAAYIDCSLCSQKMNGQTKQIEALTADVRRLQTQNAELQGKLAKASELAKLNTELSKANDNLTKKVDNLSKQLSEAGDDKKAMQDDLRVLKDRLATKDTAPAGNDNKGLLEKVKRLEEKKESLEAALAEWTELAKVYTFFSVLTLRLLMFVSAPTKSTKKCCLHTSRLRNTARTLATRNQRSIT
jgi:DNA repair exonuclease SbcCD ATPase subunit